ncbi:MAG: DUF6210 family protein [Alphaproteobacteria bacterium]
MALGGVEWNNDRPSSIELDDDENQGLGLIVLEQGGAVYSNQCGGYACHHPEAEGVYVPLGELPASFDADFARPEPKWHGRRFDGIDEETARFIEECLASSVPGGIACVAVDRARVAESEEAWVHVVIAENDHALLTAHGGKRAILTWRNSD